MTSREKMFLSRINKILAGFKAGEISARDVAFHAWDMMRHDETHISEKVWEKFFREGTKGVYMPPD